MLKSPISLDHRSVKLTFWLIFTNRWS